MLLRLGVTVAVLAVFAAVAAGALAADQMVVARSSPNAFVPAEVTINAGEKVTWTNASGTHNVRFDDGLFDQPGNPLPPPWPTVVERRFNAAGDYDYLCEQHPVDMTATVHVLPVAGPPGGSPPGGSPPGGSPPGGSPPSDPGPGDPAPALPPLRITLKLSDATPTAGTRVRLFGVVRPARDGRRVQIQKRSRRGEFRTVATTRLRDAGAARSQFSVRLRVSGDSVFRARVAGDDNHSAGVSARRKVDVRRVA